MSIIRTCKKCGAPLDLIRPAAVLLPCPGCQAPVEVRCTPEGQLYVEASGSPGSSPSAKSSRLNISQLDLFFHWEKVEESVAESLKEPFLGPCPLCRAAVVLQRTSQVTVECALCGGKTPVPVEELRLGKEEAVPTLPSSLLSFVKRLARPLGLEEKKQMVLKYLRLYRWFLAILLGIFLLLLVFALRGIFSPS